MPVLSIKCHVTDVPKIGMSALLHGVEADLIDVEGPTAYVDITGADDKINLVPPAGERVEIIEQIDKVPHDFPLFTLVGRTGFDE